MARGELTVSPLLLVYLALLVLLLPVPWIVAWIIAAGLHELGHILMLKVLRVPVIRMELGIHGAKLETPYLSAWQELWSALAGPLMGLLLVTLSGLFPRIAFCALVQSLYNLLPMYPMDGGRALRGAAALLMPERAANAVCSAVQNLVLFLIAVLAVYASLGLQLGILPLAVAIFLVLRALERKIPCKQAG